MIMVRPKKRVLTEHDDPMEEASKAREDKPVSAAEESRVLAMASLTAQVQTMIEESGNPEGFNAAKWVARWIDRPLPALGGQKPVELMGTPDGRALLHNIVARMQSGSYS